jgi:hypothetical protein
MIYYDATLDGHMTIGGKIPCTIHTTQHLKNMNGEFLGGKPRGQRITPKIGQNRCEINGQGDPFRIWYIVETQDWKRSAL